MTKAHAVIVLGMHRSGTSALTGCLGLLGVPMGGPLMEPTLDNVRGYWELVEVGLIHDELLASFDASPLDLGKLPEGWLEDARTEAARSRLLEVLVRNFGERPIWALKDPRVCVLLPLWSRLFRDLAVEPLFVLCLRSPWEVARSLETRDDLGPREALILWRRHVIDAERATRDAVRGIVRYDGLLADPLGELERLSTALAVSWPRPPAAVLSGIRSFLEPSLRHWSSCGPSPAVPEGVVTAVSELYSALLFLAERCGPADRYRLLDEADAACCAALDSWEPQDRPPEREEIEWVGAKVPSTVASAGSFRCAVTLRNRGGLRLSRRSLAISYHWAAAGEAGTPVVWDGVRTPVRLHVAAGSEYSDEVTVLAPEEPGVYLLTLDLVREGEYWLSARGAPTLARRVEVSAPSTIS